MKEDKTGLRHILITGAAGGLGLALCLEFLAQGWRVIATDMKPLMPESLAGREGLTWLPMDVTSEESVSEVAGRLAEHKVILEMVINNAGIDRYLPFSEAPTSEFQSVYEVNLFGVYRVNRSFLPLLQRPGGKIIIISSESAPLAFPFLPYPLTKKAVEGYSLALRQELWFLGIRVTMIRPGPIETDLLKNVDSIDYPVRNEVIAKAFRQFARMAPKNVGKRISPEAAARFIYSIGQKEKPKAMYRLNNDPKLRIASLLPFSLQEKIVRGRLRTNPN